MSAVTAPTLASPIQVDTNSGRLAIRSATTSPFPMPWPRAQWATRLAWASSSP